jgi:hypothetical protein
MVVVVRALRVAGLVFAFVLVAGALRDHLGRVDLPQVTPTTELGSHSRTQPLDSSNTQFRDARQWTIATTPAPLGEAVVVRSVPVHQSGVDLDNARNRQRFPFHFRPDHLHSSVLLI